MRSDFENLWLGTLGELFPRPLSLSHNRYAEQGGVIQANGRMLRRVWKQLWTKGYE